MNKMYNTVVNGMHDARGHMTVASVLLCDTNKVMTYVSSLPKVGISGPGTN